MAGVRDELILDISKTQRSLDALEAQISSAFSGVAVNVDTAGISREISAAVDAADTHTIITADTAGIPTEVARAVDAADTNVTVDADTTTARAEVRKLDQEIDRTSKSAAGLGTILTGAALVTAGRGLFSLAEAASAVNEQVTGSEVVFGNLAGQIQRFADQADRIGLGQAQALQLSNTFGQLALSAGLANQEVVNFATTIVQRGADISSLRDIDLTQTLDALRSGLVGETEPLRNLGIFINEAAVQTEAYRSGIAELGAELTDQQKIQARYNLILQQSEIAAGNFALTSDGLANKQRQVKASFQDLAADAGKILEPTFLNLANLAEDQLIPALGELGEDALPAVASILEQLAPLLGVTVDLLIAGAPILQTVANLLEIIPDPLIAIAAGWIAVNRAQKLVTKASELQAVKAMTGQVKNLRAAMAEGISPGLAGAGLLGGLGALMVITNSGAGDDIGALAGSIVGLGDSLTGFSGRRQDSIGSEVEKLVGGLDLTKLDDAQVAFAKLSSELATLDDEVGKGRLFSLGEVNIFATGGDANRQERIDQIREQIKALEDQASAELQAGLDTGRFTQSQIDAAAAQARRERSAAPLIRQVEILRAEEEAAARAAQRTIDRYAGVAAQYVATGDAAGRLRDAAPDVEAAVSRIRLSAGGSDLDFLNLATAIDGAKLSAEDMSDVAALLGVDVDSLGAFVETTTTRLTDFIDTAVGGLPAVSDVLGRVNDEVQAKEDFLAAMQERTARDVQATVRDFTRGLQTSADELGDFRDDLAAITQAGFADLAGLLAGQGFEAGDKFADELAAAVESGNLELLQGLRDANTAFETESQATVDFITNDLGPQLLSTTGLLASAISENFGSELDFEEKVRIAAELAKTELDTNGKQIAAIAAVEGEDAARAFGAALGLDQAVIDAGVRAGNAIAGIPTTDFHYAGERLGDAVAAGIEAGLGSSMRQDRINDKASQLVLQAAAAARRAGEIQSPSKVFARIGSYLGEGLVVGLDATAAQVAQAGTRAMAAAASKVPTFATRNEVTAGAAALRLHPDDIAALAAQMRPNVLFAPTVHNPVATTAESSLNRELKDMQQRYMP